MTRIPSLKTLCETFPQSDPGKLESWRAVAKRAPYRTALHKADDVIEGHGGESIRCPERGLLALYVNTGDTYSVTLLYNVASDSWRVTTWGDYVEAFERRHGRKASESLCAY